MKDLVSFVGLSDCLMDGPKARCSQIDYRQVARKLDEKVVESKAFIEKVISEVAK